MKRVIYLVLIIVIIILLLRRASGYRPFNPVSEPPKQVADVLSADECKELIENPKSPVGAKLVAMAASMAGRPKENVEPVYIIKNDQVPGHNSKCEDNDTCSEFRNLGGDRVGALVVFLNSGFKGGELLFPAHNGLKIAPKAGSAVYFRPLMSNRDVARGESVSAGTKWSAVVYVRDDSSKKIEVA